MNSQNSHRSEIPPVPKMGVRARVAEWPPRSKEPSGTSLHFPPSQPSFKPFHRRLIPNSKDVEFQEGFLGIPLRQRSSSEVTLSECDPEETPENSAPCAGLFREYGSTSSIDIQGIPEQSFFEMLNEFRAKKPEFSTLKAENRPETQHQPKDKPRRRCLKPDESIFKKLRNSRHDADPKDPEESRIPEPPKSWICRKGFAHFDVQSIFFEAVSAGAAGTQRRNTTTGASAASAGSDPAFSSTEDLNSKENLEQDLGDNTSNELLLSCPHFRNEIGGGCGERDVSFSKSGFSSSSSPSPSPPPPAAGILVESGNSLRVTNAGISILEFPKEQQRNPERIRNYSVEHADLGARYYRDYFHGKEHSNYFGVDEKLGPVAVSVRRERLEEPSEHGPQFQHRLIFRTSQLVTLRGSILEDATPSTAKAGSVRGIPLRELLEFVLPELNTHCLRLALASPKVPEQLLKLDEQGLCRRHKVGILYCKAGQSSEEEMYNNEAAGPALDEFLTLLGEKVSLKSFTKYAAQLDTKTDSTGTHSLYTTYQDYEIMFHVSTMLPYTPNNRQQLLRKRHIGNDIVTIIFQEPGALPFTPQNIRSHFQHVFIIVRAHQPCSDSVSYSVAVTRSKDVPPFGPPVPPSGVTFRRSDLFRAFLLAKAINAENAAHKSHKFRTMATRTRQEYLRDLAENYVTNTPLDTVGKFNLISLASKKKEKSKARPLAELESAGAVSWRVSALDFGRGGAEVPCVLGVSKELVVLVDLAAKEVVFHCFTGDVIGWSAEGAALRIYHGRGDLVSLRVGAGTAGSGTSGSGTSGAGAEEGAEGAAEEVKEIVQRLKMTTPGCATVDMTLRRNGLGQLGFHVHPDGSVAEVEEYGFAWQAGLRRGSRLLEVCKVAAVALSHEQMIDLLRTSVTVTVVIVPPHEDGTPRRGWSESLALAPEAEPFPEPLAGPFRAGLRSAPAWHRPPGTKRAPGLAALGARETQPGHGKRPLSFPDSPLSGSAFRAPSGSFSGRGGTERAPRGSEPHPGNSGNSGNSGHAEAAGTGHEGGAERLKEPLWHLPAPARIPGKRPGRPEPGPREPPQQRPPKDPPPPRRSPPSSSASSDPDESPRAPRTPQNPQNPQNSPNPPNLPNPPNPQNPQNPPNPARNSRNSQKSPKEPMATAPPAGRKAGSDRAAPSAAPKIPGRGREGNGELGRQVNVFGQPRLRASLRDLRSPRRVPKSSIEDDLKRLILMDNSCPEPEPAPPLHRTLSDESLCGGRRRSPHNSQNSQNSQNSPNSPNSQNAQSAPNCPNLVNFGDFGSRAEALPGSSRNTLPARRGPAARLEPGLMPLPDAAALEWATLVSAAKAYEVQRAVSLFSLSDPALSPEPPPAPPPPPRAAPLPPLSPSPAPLDLPGKVSQLEAMLKQLHSDLEKEKQDKVFLQAEVANLRQNNRRLQQESSSAARQLRRFARIFSGAAEHHEP